MLQKGYSLLQKDNPLILYDIAFVLMRFSTTYLSIILLFASLLLSIPGSSQDKFDRKVVCFQQQRIDSILQFVKKKRDVSFFFDKMRLKDLKFFHSQMELVRRGLIKHKKMSVDREVHVWSGMLPRYEETYYFEMKDDRVIVVFIGFTAVAKFPGWEKVLNFTVKHWSKEQAAEHKTSVKAPVSNEEWIRNQTIQYVKVGKDMCQ
jgi:hypothetical protein